jgi:hypothetical protein
MDAMDGATYFDMAISYACKKVYEISHWSILSRKRKVLIAT